MDSVVCLPQTNLFIGILVLIFLSVYYYYWVTDIVNNTNTSNSSLIEQINSLKQNINDINKMNSISAQLQSVKQQPYSTRTNQNNNNNNFADNGPSRQYVNNYNDNQTWLVVGYLYDNLNNRYVLYSRNLYPGNNNRMEYYIVDDSRNHIEIPFSTMNNKEIMDGDPVVVPTVTGPLIAKIYDIQQYKYNPNL